MVVRSVSVVGLLVLAGLSLSASVVGVDIMPAAGSSAHSPGATTPHVPAQALVSDAHRLDLPMHLPLPVQASWEAFVRAMGR